MKTDEKTFLVLDEAQVVPKRQNASCVKKMVLAAFALITSAVIVGAVLYMKPCSNENMVVSSTPVASSNTTLVSKAGLNINCGAGCDGCCSQYGYCGTSPQHCGFGCQADLSGPGKCTADVTENISVNGRCGVASDGASCPDSQCCSQWLWCGTTADHCLLSKNCHPLLGNCWEKDESSSTTSSSETKPAEVTEAKKSEPTQAPAQQAPAPSSGGGGGSGGYSRSSTLTWYTYGGNPNYCEGITHAESDLVVAMSTNMLLARGDCRRSISSIEIYSPSTRRSVVARVVDMCNEAHGCASNVVDGTRGIWAALGIDLAQGVHNIQWKWL